MLRRRLFLEGLEDRRLLAVTATFNSGSGLLTITGDAVDNELLVTGLGRAGSAAVAVTGLGAIGTFDGVRSVRANLSGGNDDLFIVNLQIGGDFNINMGSGTDTIEVLTDAGFLGSGPILIGGSFIASMGNNAGDFVSFAASTGLGITVGRDLRVTQVADVNLVGFSTNPNFEEADINVGNNLAVSLSNFGDVNGDTYEIDLNDFNVGGNTTLTGSSAGDRIRSLDGNFVRKITVNMGGGNDVFDIENGAGNGNRFGDRLIVSGAAGTDEYQIDGENIFAIPGNPTLTSIEIIS